MECLITRTNEDIRWNILVEVNTTSCIANGYWEQLESICSYRIPFTLYASLIEVDAKNHTTIVVTAVLLLIALAILIIGSGFYCKTNIQRAANLIRKRIIEAKK